MICAVVLAAGQSLRMGVQKLLLPFAGTTVIGHIVGQIVRGPVDHTIVVVGADRQLVIDAVDGLGAAIAVNPDVGADMLSSVRCGLRALPERCSAVLVALGDQPSITTSLVEELVAAFGDSAWPIVVPVHQGKRGHPMLISMRYRQEILMKYDDVGLRGLLADHPQDIFQLPVTTQGVLDDMDRPEDYRREISRQRQRCEG